MGQWAAAVRLLAAMLPSLLLALWGWLLLWSGWSGRLSLLLREAFHPLVSLAGALLLLLAGLWWLPLGRRRPPALRLRASGAVPWHWLLSAGASAAVLAFPPAPSFSDLAATRPTALPDGPVLIFHLPPEQRSQPDPALHDGAPVRISGFVLERSGQPPQLARLLVRCCLADATPAGLDVAWPGGVAPAVNQWLEIDGTMTVKSVAGRQRPVVVPERITPIPRPERPLEP
jgi:uncharacterized repeat protein (TIGR03943 family)